LCVQPWSGRVNRTGRTPSPRGFVSRCGQTAAWPACASRAARNRAKSSPA
jgi:hypothetical protein